MSSRRRFLLSLAAAPAAAAVRAGSLPSETHPFSDPATEFRVLRLTDPAHASYLPPPAASAVSRHDSFLIFMSDRSGALQPYRMEIKSGESRQIAEASGLHPEALALSPDEKSVWFADREGLHQVALPSLRRRTLYRFASGAEPGGGLGISSDGLYAALVQKTAGRHSVQLIRVAQGSAAKIAEAGEELSSPQPRPRRAGLIYRRGTGELWLASFDGVENRRLAIAGGGLGTVLWSREGRSILYLNVPSDTKRLANVREFTPDANQDQWLSDTSRFATFASNADASVFAGASASKASPFVLLLVRSVRRELTVCEHRSSDPSRVWPRFSPSSQRLYFQTDKDGKMAIYTMLVDRLVEQTDG